MEKIAPEVVQAAVGEPSEVEAVATKPQAKTKGSGSTKVVRLVGGYETIAIMPTDDADLAGLYETGRSYEVSEDKALRMIARGEFELETK